MTSIDEFHRVNTKCDSILHKLSKVLIYSFFVVDYNRFTIINIRKQIKQWKIKSVNQL